jgi:hypothetical protein
MKYFLLTLCIAFCCCTHHEARKGQEQQNSDTVYTSRRFCDSVNEQVKFFQMQKQIKSHLKLKPYTAKN